MHHFHTKLPHQKPLLRQIECGVQSGSIIKNGILPVTNLFFWTFYFSLRTSYKELIWCTNDPNYHILIFCKGWSFILRCFFPVSILKTHFVSSRLSSLLQRAEWSSVSGIWGFQPTPQNNPIGETYEFFRKSLVSLM